MGGLSEKILTLEELLNRKTVRKTWQEELWDKANVDKEMYYRLKEKYVDVPTMLANYINNLILHVVELEKGLQYWVGLNDTKELTDDVIKSIPKNMLIKQQSIIEVIHILKSAFNVYETYENELVDSEVDKSVTYSEMIEKMDMLNIRFCKCYKEFYSAMENVIATLQKYYQTPLTIEDAVAKISKKWVTNFYMSFNEFIESISNEEKVILLTYSFDNAMCNHSLEELCSSDMYKHLKFIAQTLSKFNGEEFNKISDIFKEIDTILKGYGNESFFKSAGWREVILDLQKQYKGIRDEFMFSVQEIIMNFQLKEAIG